VSQHVSYKKQEPLTLREHLGLNKISEDLVTNMQQMIDTAIKAREKQELVEPILEECKQQIVFCQHKSNGQFLFLSCFDSRIYHLLHVSDQIFTNFI
jgi:hypothetical protein